MNEQMVITYAPPTVALIRNQQVTSKVRQQPWRFRPDFPQWLGDNYAVWERFEREANDIYGTGRHHYSARTIGEYLRHETALHESPARVWKLNDHRWPDLARLYVMLYPERTAFFELRGRGE